MSEESYINDHTSASLKEEVMVQKIDGEAVFLQLDDKQYFSLDKIGTRMLELITEEDSILTASEILLKEYDVKEEVLKKDLDYVIMDLLDNNIISISIS